MGHLVQDGVVQGLVSDQLLQPGVIFLEAAYLADLSWREGSILDPPPAEGLQADRILATELGERPPASAWVKQYAICSAVNFDLRIGRSPPL